MRVRTNNVFGTLTDAPLTAGATTMNAAGLTNLDVVSGSDHAVITLDPNREHGAPEIVFVTAHTSSATSATISRGEFDTSAREHPTGTEWVHGPVAEVSPDDGDFGGFWSSWTPTLANITQGNGTVVAEFTRIGDLVTYMFRFVLGSTSAIGTTPTFTLPVAAHADYVGAVMDYGRGQARDTGTGSFELVGLVSSGTVVQPVCLDASNPIASYSGITATSPFTWTTGDSFFVSGTYRTA